MAGCVYVPFMTNSEVRLSLAVTVGITLLGVLVAVVGGLLVDADYSIVGYALLLIGVLVMLGGIIALPVRAGASRA